MALSHRLGFSISLPPEVVAALKAEAASQYLPLSRVLEGIVRRALPERVQEAAQGSPGHVAARPHQKKKIRGQDRNGSRAAHV